jgi:hypothetical protein
MRVLEGFLWEREKGGLHGERTFCYGSWPRQKEKRGKSIGQDSYFS